MALAAFIVVLLIAFGIALASKRGAIGSSMHDVMVASGSFGGFLLFFIMVGEIYSVTTMIGGPGSIYARGTTYGIWYIGYILLAYVVGYFVNPAIWKLGQLSKASTISDILGWRFNSKSLQFVVALAGIVFLTPLAQNQFAGMGIVLRYLDIGISFNIGIILSCILAFVFIAIAGIRAPAWVSVFKDILLIAVIIAVGGIAISSTDGGIVSIFKDVADKMPEMLVVETQPVTLNVTFFVSTILFQMVGFYMLPVAVQSTLTSKNERNLRRNSILMPIYMLMFPFLVIIAYFALLNMPGLENKDFAFLAVAELLPHWVIGLVAGGATLTAVLVLALYVLSIGGLFSKNILGLFKPDMNEKTMVKLTNLFTALVLIVAAFCALFLPNLMANVLMVGYAGLTQVFAAMMCAFFWKRATKQGVVSGLIVGYIAVFVLKNAFTVMPFGITYGAYAMLINIIVIVAVSFMTKQDVLVEERFHMYKHFRKN